MALNGECAMYVNCSISGFKVCLQPIIMCNDIITYKSLILILKRKIVNKFIIFNSEILSNVVTNAVLLVKFV